MQKTYPVSLELLSVISQVMLFFSKWFNDNFLLAFILSSFIYLKIYL